MIKYPRTRKKMTLLDMTPMVDVVFLLLVFFLLTSTSIQHSVDIDLPETRSGVVQPAKPLVVTILPDDTLRINQQTVAWGRLGEVLRSRLDALPKRALTIEADRRAAFGSFARVLDAAKLAGATEISLGTEILTERRAP